MNILKAVAVAAMLALGAPVLADEAGDAVFAERGPWALGDDSLVWHLTVDGPEAESFFAVKDGSVALAEIADPSDGQPVLQLTVNTGTQSRKIGPFPASGGDPVLTFFLEQTARDMARLTGGSPFYIRNRIKDALFRGGEISNDGDVTTAVFTPFADDPNAERMHGFGTLTLTFVMADPKDPIRDFLAETGGDTPGYRNHMVME